MDIQNDSSLPEFPPGYRFSPTDEQLVTYYLMNKVFDKPLPTRHAIQEIHHSDLHGKPPSHLVPFSGGERVWYFFIHEEEVEDSIRLVGDGEGFWKVNGEELPIRNSDGNVFAMKTHFTYFSGTTPNNAKKTHWKLDKYRLLSNLFHKGEKWVLGRLIRGREYASSF